MVKIVPEFSQQIIEELISPLANIELRKLKIAYEEAYKNYTGTKPTLEQFYKMTIQEVKRG